MRALHAAQVIPRTGIEQDERKGVVVVMIPKSVKREE
jgi:hypothetical protein